MIWNRAHPERDSPHLRSLAWRIAAELAVVAPENAAILITCYESAETPAAAARAAVTIELEHAKFLEFLCCSRCRRWLSNEASC